MPMIPGAPPLSQPPPGMLAALTGATTNQPAMPPQPDEPQSFEDALAELIDDARLALELAPDEQSALAIERVTTIFQQLLAGFEKDRDKAMGMTPQLRSIRG